MTPDIDREIEGEVTRAEEIEYLEGATGHAVASMVFVMVGGYVFWSTGSLGLSGVAFAAALLVSANRLSIYLWDRARNYVRSETEDTSDDGPTRELTPASFSAEGKETLVGGFTQLATLIAVLLLCGGVLQLVDPQTGVVLIVGGVVVGNIGGLLWVYRIPTE